MTQVELSEAVSVTQPTIAGYEAGKEPKADAMNEALASVLRVEPSFLTTPDDDLFAESEYNFRSVRSTSERLRKKLIAQAALFGVAIRALKTHVPRLAVLDLPSCSVDQYGSTEGAALAARAHCGLPANSPIDSITTVLERAGVVVTVAQPDTEAKVDAFSRYGPTSVAVFNTAKGSSSRTFFDAAHELGHGVLHYRAPARPHDVREAEAQSFAADFLMPSQAFRRSIFAKGHLDWKNLFELKQYWNASAAAIIYRAYRLGLIDAVEYRRKYQDLSRRGWRTDEPHEREPEQATAFVSALAAYCKRTQQSTVDFAKSLGISPSLFSEVTGVPVSQAATGVIALSAHRERKRKTPEP